MQEQVNCNASLGSDDTICFQSFFVASHCHYFQCCRIYILILYTILFWQIIEVITFIFQIILYIFVLLYNFLLHYFSATLLVLASFCAWRSASLGLLSCCFFLSFLIRAWWWFYSINWNPVWRWYSHTLCQVPVIVGYTIGLSKVIVGSGFENHDSNDKFHWWW